MTVAEALRAEQLRIARATVDLLVRAVTGERRVQRPAALRAAEALLVPHGALGQLLFGRKDGATAARTAVAVSCLDRRGVRGGKRLGIGDLFVTAMESGMRNV